MGEGGSNSLASACERGGRSSRMGARWWWLVAGATEGEREYLLSWINITHTHDWMRNEWLGYRPVFCYGSDVETLGLSKSQRRETHRDFYSLFSRNIAGNVLHKIMSLPSNVCANVTIEHVLPLAFPGLFLFSIQACKCTPLAFLLGSYI